MGQPDTRRQLAFFLAALFLPCAVLVVLGLRVMAQEEELAEKRRSDSRLAFARSVGQELRTVLVEVAAADRDALRAGYLTHPSTLAVLAVDGGRLVAPWRKDAVAQAFALAVRSPGVARELRAGQQAELVKQDRAKAVAAYQRAARATNVAAAVAYARFLIARTQAAGEPARSDAYRALTALGPDMRDDDGVPIATHAFARLAPLSDRPAATRIAFERLSQSLGRSVWLSPTACYAMVAIEETRFLPARRCAELERLGDLSSERPPPPGEWRVAAGNEAPGWLVFTTATARGDTVALVARLDTSLGGAAPSAALLAAASMDSSDQAIPGGNGLWLVPAKQQDGTTPARMLYIVSVVLTIVVGALGGFLLLRDVRREAATTLLRSQFVAGVSHELKTPLTSIRMFAETMRDRALPDEQRAEYLDTVVGETQRLTRLLNNVLEFSRIDRGESKYAFTPVDVRGIVDTALRAMRHPLEQLGFTVLVQREEAPLMIRGDADAIEQAVLNLLGNAVKYSADTRDLRLSVRRRGPDAVIAVTDFGVGIPGGEQQRIFEKFYRAPMAINASVAGTGLGLTLVKHIAEAHGGRVCVRSTEGRGSTFEIAIPIGGTRAASPPVPANLDPAVAG